MDYNTYLIRGKCIICIAVSFLLISFGLTIQKKDIFANSKNNLLNKKNKEVSISNVKKREYASNNSAEYAAKMAYDYIEDDRLISDLVEEAPWHRPVEIGNVSTFINGGHIAYDITSPRGANEVIYPIANGVVASIYTDAAGALTVIVNHEVDGVKYSSMYVHLSRYADGLYVGKELSYKDPIGMMGTTGYSTGVHLHISLADCEFGSGSCKNINEYFNYLRVRYNQGFNGISSVINIPSSWSSRED